MIECGPLKPDVMPEILNKSSFSRYNIMSKSILARLPSSSSKGSSSGESKMGLFEKINVHFEKGQEQIE